MGKKYGEDLEWVLCDCDWGRIGGLGVVYVQESSGELAGRDNGEIFF
ncbi:hypothetical protein [Rossellomorea vietnamensis]|nr:hypothetical protein [Rossellomorea vietnamensis]